MLKDGISVIICCYNSGWIIKRCLLALIAQVVRKGLLWEVILVDNNCTDNTVAVALGTMAISEVDFRIVKEMTPGLLNARKKGISEVQYAYTIYCDDDNLLCPKYVDTMYQILSSNPQIGAAGGKGIAEFQVEPDSRILKYIEGYAVGSQLGHKDFLFGAGLAVRTDVVRDIYSNQKMYLTGRMGNKLLAGDDTELTMAILLRGYVLYPTDEIAYTHVLKKERLTFEYKEKMFAGFRLSRPVVFVMKNALNGKPFFCTIYTYVTFLMNYLKSFLGGRDAKVKKMKCRLILSDYHSWGICKLREIHKEWRSIKDSLKKNINK